MAGVALGELGLAASLDPVVELVGHAGSQLVDDALHVEVLQCEGGEQAVQQLGVVEVAADRLVDARVLHLHRDDPPVGQDRAVDLTDRCCGDRDRVPLEEEPLGLVAELLADDPSS